MPKFERIYCDLRGVEVYRGGEYVQGEWVLQIGETVKVKFIDITFYGATFVKWTETQLGESDKKLSTHEEHVKSTIKAMAEKNVETELQPGTYKYPFRFYIPKDRMPSSFQGKYGATKWYVRINIGRPVPFPNVDQYRMLTFIDDYPLTLPYYSKSTERGGQFSLSKAFGLGDGGHVTLHASLNKIGFCAGEYALLNVTAENKSTKDLGSVQAKVYQEVRYKGNTEENQTLTCLRTIHGNPLKKGGKSVWKNQKVTIDAVPNSTQKRSTYCIAVSYFIKVIVPVPFYNGKDISVRLNFDIGTAPTGQREQAAARPAGNAMETDASKAKTYTRCNKGWECFSESCKTYSFPLSNYVPMCVYNSNYNQHKDQNTTTPVSQKSIPKNVSSAATKAKPDVTSGDKTSSGGKDSATSHFDEDENLALDFLPPYSTTVPLEPSAPPSYESVVSDTDDVREDSDDDEETTCYMLIKFPSKSMEIIMKGLEQTKPHLKKFNGKPLCITTKIHKSTGAWPSDTLIAMVQFESQTEATEWYSMVSQLSAGSWLEGCQIIVTKAKEKFQEGKKAISFVLAKIKHRDPPKTAEFKHIVTEYLKPTRLAQGGLLLLATSTADNVKGNWNLTTDEILSVSAWDSQDSKIVSCKLFPRDVYERYRFLSNDIYDMEYYVHFDVESLEDEKTAEQ